MQDVDSGISERVGVDAVEARPGSIRVAVLIGVELGIGDGVSPNKDSAAEILDFYVRWGKSPLWLLEPDRDSKSFSR